MPADRPTSPDWLPLFFTKNPQPMFVFDLETLKFLAVNDAALRFYGYSRSAFLRGTLLSIRPKSEVRKLIAAVKPWRTRPGYYSGVWTHLKRGGRRVEVSVLGHRITYSGRRAWLSLIQDITQQKNLENALSRSEKYWRALLEQAPDFLLVVDRRLRIRYINRLAKGFNMRSVIGTPFDRYITPEFRKVARRNVLSVFQTGRPASYENRAQGNQGKLVWYLSRASPILRGKRVEEVIIAASDITERRLLRSRFEGVFKGSRDAIDYVALDGTLLEVNPAFERMTGYSRDELIEQKRFQDLTPPEYHHLDRKAVSSLLTMGQPCEWEKEYRRKDGTRVPINLTAFVVRGSTGKTEGFAAIIKDISERRKLERAILEASASEQGKFGRDLHDTLGQTLTGLSLLSKALRSKLGRRGAVEVPEAARLTELSSLAVRQARGLARGLLPGELQSADLASALRQLAGNARELFGIRCMVSAPSKVIIGEGSTAVQLYRIAQEAVHNAAKYARSPAGVRIRLRALPGELRLDIIDYGSGIPSPKRRHRGLGLGIMAHRARMMGGTLTVLRVPQGGTVVTCRCPRARPLQPRS